MLPRTDLVPATLALFIAVVVVSTGPCGAASPARQLPEGVQPTIGAWFCGDDFLEPDGYKMYVDLFADRSPYDLLTTSFRVNRREITEPAVHDQVKAAVAYARERGLKIALDLDVRLAREAFRSRYPDEQQEMLRLRTVALAASGEAECAITSDTLTDHMTGNTTPYLPLAGRLVRVYAYAVKEGTILPETVRDITERCVVKTASSEEVRVVLPCDASTAGHTACVMAAFAHLTPDVYAPHLLAFQRALVEQYADVPLDGLLKDEWGFPPCHGGCPPKNDFWFSHARAAAYAEASGGRDLVRDCLLMHAGEEGRERERQAAINLLLKTSRVRNAAIEEHYYNLAKEFFGPAAAVVTHATWTPYPGPSEFKKNGLDWWAAKRDWGQTDEDTPFPARTALAKKWGGSVWYNQFYSTEADDYRASLWSHALGGGRINYHPIYPTVHGEDRIARISKLLAPDIVAGESRIRLLQLITHAPIDCPVAVVFGHACAMNWAGPAYDDVGLAVTDALWQAGNYADLIPTSEIESGALKIAEDGAVTYGPQHYAAVVLYHPEFEQPETAAFFSKVNAASTALFRVGGWTRDFSANDFSGDAALPPAMTQCADAAEAAANVAVSLRERGVAPRTPASQSLRNKTACPAREGQIRLVDGTEVVLAGTNDTAGDPVTGTMQLSGHEVTAEARGVLAVRFTANGEIDALAAGGLKRFTGGNLSLQFDTPVDIAYWHDADGRPRGALQNAASPLPEALSALTGDWLQLATPRGQDPAASPSFTVWQLPNQASSQIMSYVIRTAGGKLVVIDGGRDSDAAYLRNFIQERGGRVEAWFVTHVHDDHCAALAAILQDPQGIEVNTLYASLPDTGWFAKVCDAGELKTHEVLTAALEKSGRAFTMLSAGDAMDLDGVRIAILGGCNPEILKNPINNSSMVLRVSDARKSILFLGDLGVEGGEKLLAGPQAAFLPSDYVQMAHHGQNGVGEAVYQKVNPKYCLWPTPKWLWDNNSGTGEDSGSFRTKEVRKWTESLPVQKHYLMFDGLQTVE